MTETDITEAKSLSSFLNITFITGNGFDLGLGLKTSYQNFYKSSICTIKKMTSGLAKAIKDRYDENDQWFDIENILLEYARKSLDKGVEEVEKDKNDFYTIKEELRKYIERQDNRFWFRHQNRRRNMLPARVCDAIKELISDMSFPPYLNEPLNLFSFNYTRIEQFYDTLSYFSTNSPRLLHNCCDTQGGRKPEIILGIYDENIKNTKYGFLCKDNQEGYDATPLNKSLKNSLNIILYGVSLGENDYHYFQDLFNEICRDEEYQKHVWIFTRGNKDKESLIDKISIGTNKSKEFLLSRNLHFYFDDDYKNCSPKAKGEYINKFKRDLCCTLKQECFQLIRNHKELTFYDSLKIENIIKYKCL